MHSSLSKRNGLITQIIILHVFLAGSTVFLATVLEQGFLRTVSLLVFVSYSGLFLSRRLEKHLGDPKLSRLGYVWIAKLFFAIFLLYAGWVPDLDVFSSASWGYDPQRYYMQAKMLVEDNFRMIDSHGQYFVGVLYYYGTLFAIFGHNPVVPALVNCFVTLAVTLMLVSVGYRIKQSRGPHDWTLGLAMVMPEVLWYDVLTARESIVMALLTVLVLIVGRHLVLNEQGRSLSISDLLLILIALFGIGIIRTSMLYPTLLAVLILLMVTRTNRVWTGFLVVLLLAAVIYLSPQISVQLGALEFDSERVVRGFMGRDTTAQHYWEWKERSIGALLVPNTPGQAVLFALPRTFVYLVSPLPHINFTVHGLREGSWAHWQALLSTLSAVLHVSLFPLAIAGLWHAATNKEFRARAILFIAPFWTLFVGITAGLNIIHDRFRVMVLLLLWGCIWLATSCPRKTIYYAYVGWLFAVVGALTFYFVYKTLY